MLIGRAPVRISFAGGGTDIRDYYSQHGGMVVSAAINKYFYVIVTPREEPVIQLISADYQTVASVEDYARMDVSDGPLGLPKAVLRYLNIKQGLNIFLASEIPPGTGLGSSGAVAVALLNTLASFNGGLRPKHEIAERAFFVETEILNMPIGKQDQYASAFGGLNVIHFNENGVRVEPLKMAPEMLSRFEKRIMLFFTGSTRDSASILRKQKAQTGRSESKTMEALDNIKRLATEVKETLEAGDLDHFGDLLHESWENKKQIVPEITNERIDRAYSLARENGARGGKITGAGGGGFLMIYCDEAKQPKVKTALESEGLLDLSFKFDFEGATIVMKSSFFEAQSGMN